MRFFVLPWLLTAACSSAPASGAAQDAAADVAGPEGFTAADAGSFDPDADLGLACTGAAPSFVAAIAPILEGCAGGELCHGFPAPPVLYGQLVGAPASDDGCDAGVLVTPKSLQRSYLLHKLTGLGMCPRSQRMPPGGELSPDDLQTITDWICAGAPND